ncbi:hypothetical protein BV22DRAFT_1055422 [Leucogyrophana mollusca]|uniref:Uncharacterized protein n=1 Tax=Leucogyrophana mollusca TaxID=85980 RepID=A0ACB8BWZ0_9AGAM|nr:hypothetical protein BV22DRAFT_1055422 [Leucogyrophana mollusca]
MMHRCLQVPEILDNIALKIYERPIAPSSSWDDWGGHHFREARAALACLARTCRMFKDPALDVLWSFLKSFDPLIRCLLQDSWMEDADGFLISSRPLCSSDGLVFQHYAKRVRVFGDSDVAYALFEPVSNDMLGALCSVLSDTCYFLPNLQELNWFETQDNPFYELRSRNFYTLLPLFLSPRLTCLRLGLCTSSDLSTHVLPAISSLHISVPFIKHFQCFDTSEGFMQSISEIIPQWHHFEYVDVGALSQNAITHLCSMKSLKHLGVRLDQRDHNASANFPPSLESFAMFAPTLEACWRYLEDIHIACGHLLVDLTPRPGPSASSIQQFFAFIPSRFSATNLHILDVVSHGDQLDPTLAWSLGTFQPLFTFKNLTAFRTPSFCSAKLSDRDLEEIALAWPQLEVLELGTGSDWRAPSLITFNGLLSVLQHCRQLRELGLVMDATVLAPITTDASNINITLFSVGCSDIHDPRAVAAFLLGILPRLRKIKTSDLWFNPEFEDRKTAWSKVEELLESFSITGELEGPRVEEG